MSVDDLGFNPNWLTERFPFDSEARNATVECSCLKDLNTVLSPVVVDLGCGNGANTKYFIDRLERSHTWILVDSDQRLLQHAMDHLKGLDDYQLVTQDTDQIVLQKGAKQVIIKTVCGSLLELNLLLDLSTIDLLMSNAVFDLFSEAQFTGFAMILQEHSLPFLSTLNYANMRFSPAAVNDKLFLAYYEEHMQREQDFGQGMGKQCAVLLPIILKDLGATLTTGESNWNIKPTDKRMLNFMYDYLNDSLHELSMTIKNRQLLDLWLAEKRHAIDLNGVGLQVGHYDLYGTFH